MTWACGIVDCDARFEDAERLVRHQVTDHRSDTCGVCGETTPAGFFAIRHAFEEHTRAEYLRAYDADSDDIRLRERIKEEIESRVDVPSLLETLDIDAVDTAASTGD